jgi:hypothetical protein
MHTAAKLCLLAAAPLLASAQDFEWAGVFSLNGAVSPSKWSMQAAADGTYPEQSMKIVIIPTSTPDAATLASLESDANTLVAGTCTAVADAASMTPDAAGSCFTLTVGSDIDSEFDIVTTDLAGVAVFAQHTPIKFERDRHYFYDSAATPADIEPIAENLAFEWSGVFPLDGATSPSKWHMQAGEDGTYPDESMILVIIPTAAEDVATVAVAEAAMETLEDGAKALLGLFGASCTAVAAGGTMTPAGGGSCVILNVDTASADSEFDIVTTGLTGVAVFAQHIPIEFERDRHYFIDGAGLDLEPFAESEHDVAHSHGQPDASPGPAVATPGSGASTATAVMTVAAAGAAVALL